MPSLENQRGRVKAFAAPAIFFSRNRLAPSSFHDENALPIRGGAAYAA
jgi:hypothetical protein